jgi:hypothetical protein
MTMARHRILVTKKALEDDKHTVWNAFVELLAMAKYDDLAPSRRGAHLAFFYDAEVQNGGHLQYFHNRRRDPTAETIQALDALGADDQARILEQALARWNSAARLLAADLREYSAIAMEGEFEDLDSAFYRCPVQIMDHLERYLAAHEADFIERE